MPTIHWQWHSTNFRKGAKDRGQYRQAAGAVEKALNLDQQLGLLRVVFNDALSALTRKPVPHLGHVVQLLF